MRRRWKALALGLLGVLVAAGVWAQGTGVNPPVGSIWTYLGATYGAGWVPNPNAFPTCVSIEAFGGKGDDFTDNAGPFNVAKASAACLSFPAGTYRFNSAIAYNFAANTRGLTITGQGQDVTTLHFPNAVGTALTINMVGLSNSFHLRDFTLTTGTTNADVAVKVVQTRAQVAPRHASGYANSDITRITLRSDEGYWEQDAGNVTHGWKTGVWGVGVSVINFVEFTFYGPKPATGGFAGSGGNGGTGVLLERADPGTWIPVLYNFDRANINWAEFGIVYGNGIQGIQISSSNIVNCYLGVYVPPGEVDLALLSITGSQLNNIRNVFVDSVMPQLILTGNLFYTPNDDVGVTIARQNFMTNITGNAFAGLTAHAGRGLVIAPDLDDAAPPVITGNWFWEFQNAIHLGVHEGGALISGNMYRNNTWNIINLNTSPYTIIAGGTPAADFVGNLPAYQLISGAVDNGSGKTRVTVSSTLGFFNGQLVLTGNIGGIASGLTVATSINVVDATHIDLMNVNFSGPYTTGGFISSVPL